MISLKDSITMEDEEKWIQEAGPSNPAATRSKYIFTSIASTENLHSSKNKKQISYFIKTSSLKRTMI